MRNKAINALIKMGMPADIKGFQYIVDAMCLFNADYSTTALYSVVAQKNNTTSSRVERAIRHAFCVALKDGVPGYVDKYLTRNHATNGNLLHVLYLRLSQED